MAKKVQKSCFFTIWHTITPKLNFCPKCFQKCSIRFNLIILNVWCQIVLVPNCPLPNCPGAKLSGCQIVRFYYLGAKLSDLLSWCQIVRCQIVLQSSSILRLQIYSQCQQLLGKGRRKVDAEQGESLLRHLLCHDQT